MDLVRDGLRRFLVTCIPVFFLVIFQIFERGDESVLWSIVAFILFLAAVFSLTGFLVELIMMRPSMTGWGCIVGILIDIVAGYLVGLLLVLAGVLLVGNPYTCLFALATGGLVLVGQLRSAHPLDI